MLQLAPKFNQFNENMTYLAKITPPLPPHIPTRQFLTKQLFLCHKMENEQLDINLHASLRSA